MVLLVGVAGIGLVSRETASPPALPVPIDTEPEGGWSAFPGPTYRLAPGVRVSAQEAPAFALEGDLDRRRVELLKEALGVRGEFARRGDWWQIEYGTRVLRIEEGPTRPWFFFTPPGAAAPPATGPVPTPAEAERIGRDLLTSAGFQLGPRTEVNRGGDHWNVNVEPAFGGVPLIGMPMSVVVGRGGAIVSAMGHLATAENLGRYRLTPLEGAVDSMNGTPAPNAAPPRLVKSARLVHTRMFQFDMYARAVVLAPHYELTLDDGSTVSHLAVAAEHLDPRRPPDPSDEQPIPEPEPYPAP